MVSSFPDFIGGYKILEKLGAGSMGEVYKAVKDGQVVALKIITPHFNADHRVHERFLREIEVMKKLHHPSIVQAIDSGRDKTMDIYFIAMEFIQGQTLEALLETQGPLPVFRAVEITLTALEGLDYAFSMEMVHRDIKPANILIDSEGRGKIFDFGLAKMPGNQGNLTQEGMILGTPYYLAPEQAFARENVDIRSDLYSLGITLFHMLSGTPPFVSNNVLHIITAHCFHPLPPLLEYRQDVPSSLEEFLHKMTQKDREDRYGTPKEAIEALKKIPLKKPEEKTGEKPVKVDKSTCLLSWDKMKTWAGGPSSPPPSVPQKTFLKKGPPPISLSPRSIFSPSQGFSGYRTQRIKILVIEDDPIMGELLLSALEEFCPQAHLIWEKNGKTGLARTREELPHLLLTDIHLPELSGLEILRALREDPQTAQIPKLVLTGFPKREIKSAAYNAGADDFIFKPLHLQELKAKVLFYLQRIQFCLFMVGNPSKEWREVEEMVKQIFPHLSIFRAFEGRSAAKWAYKIGPSVILMDMMLLELSGLLVCQILRANPSTSQIPIILVGEFPENELREKAYTAGADDFIFKPIFVGELRRKINRALGFSLEKTPGAKGIFPLVQKLIDQQLNGVLDFLQDGQRGKIFFEKGKILHAFWGDKPPEEAFFELMSLEEVFFEFSTKTFQREEGLAGKNSMDLLEKASNICRGQGATFGEEI